MRPFRFRLLKLKEQRLRIRRERQLRHAQAEREWAARKNDVAAVLADRHRQLDGMARRRVGEVDLPWEALSRDYLDRLDVEQDRSERAFAAAGEERETARASLLEASRAYRTLERLEDRQRAEHLVAERRREEKELDEFAQEIRSRERGAAGGGAQLPDLSP